MRPNRSHHIQIKDGVSPIWKFPDMKRFRKRQHQRHHGERHGAEVDHADDEIVMKPLRISTLNVQDPNDQVTRPWFNKKSRCMWDVDWNSDRPWDPSGRKGGPDFHFFTEASRISNTNTIPSRYS
jgi:hypothetical protein